MTDAWDTPEARRVAALPIVTTVGALRDELLVAFGVWLLYGRGAEGMTPDELAAAMQRLPNVSWLALYAANPLMAKHLLFTGHLEPDSGYYGNPTDLGS